MYLVKREHDPEIGLNENHHFVVEKFTEEVGGVVGSLLSAVLDGHHSMVGHP